MATRPRLAARTGLVAIALAVGAALVSPAPAQAAPGASMPDLSTLGATLGGASSLESLSLGQIPLDAELAEILRTLKSNGGDQKLIEALQAILGAEGSPDLNSLTPGGTDPAPSTPESTSPESTTPGTTTPGTSTPESGSSGSGTPESGTPESGTATPEATPTTPTAPGGATPSPAAGTPAAKTNVDDPLTTAGNGLAVFEKITGAKVLTPAFAPFCAPTTSDNPMGLVTAPAVGVPGPFPKVGAQGAREAIQELLDQLSIGQLGDLLDQNEDLKELTTALTADQTAFALVPPTGHTNDHFQVAWFNTATMDGGIADLKKLSEVSNSKALQALAGSAPVRLARVDTGQGSILTAVFGTTTNAGRTCYFLPAIGVVDTPAK